MEFNSRNDVKLKDDEKKEKLNVMNNCCPQMFLQLISIPGCASKSRTISISDRNVAQINGVLLNIGM